MNIKDAILSLKQRNYKLITLDDTLSDPKALKEFCKLLKTSELDELILDYNSLIKSDFKKIIKATKKSKHIKSILIQGPIPPKTIAYVHELLGKHPTLKINFINIAGYFNPNKIQTGLHIVLRIPNDLLAYIFSFLPYLSLYKVASTCKKFEYIATKAYYLKNQVGNISMAAADKIFNKALAYGKRLRVYLRNSLIEKQKLIHPLHVVQIKIDDCFLLYNQSSYKYTNSHASSNSSYNHTPTLTAVSPFGAFAYNPAAAASSSHSAPKNYNSGLGFFIKEKKYIVKKLGPFDVTIEKLLINPDYYLILKK